MKVMTHDVFDSSQPLREDWTCVPEMPVGYASRHLHSCPRRQDGAISLSL
jgi:hypothetical protein